MCNNKSDTGLTSLFRNPTGEFRSAPFWAWNGDVSDHALMKKQMDDFCDMGFGGFHIHARIGLTSEYLGADFMDSVKFCNRYASEKGMLTYLYDEDKWPSGYGGGRVTKEYENRARYLLMSPYYHADGHLDRHLKPSNRLTENGDVTLLHRFRIQLENGLLKSYQMLEDGQESDEQTWYVYRVVTDRLPWFNNEAYSDNLNPRVVERFLKETYEPYRHALGDQFSKTVPSIFTDEPQFVRVQTLSDGAAKEEVGIPYTDDFEDLFQKAYGTSLMAHLPELFWTRADGVLSQVKYQYFDLLAERFSEAYAGTLGKWCKANHLALTGHVMAEESLEGQTRCVGEAMRAYPHFQIPGIDILAARYEYTTAKQAQSAARQMGADGITSELYGVTNWDYDFRGHKLQGDWQAAFGVTHRVPHLAWLHMGGESKRDYPAPIDSHSPWYRQYHQIEDYFARLHTVLRRGKPAVNIAVVHPIESMWMQLGPDRQTAEKREQLERHFQSVVSKLLFAQYDFDFLSEAVLTKLPTDAEDGRLQVGEMAYGAVVVPELITIRRTTLVLLKKFVQNGGQVFYIGRPAAYVDGVPSDEAASFLRSCTYVPSVESALVPALEAYRQVEIAGSDYLRASDLVYQMRDEGTTRWVFIAHGREKDQTESNPFLRRRQKEKHIVKVKGQWDIQVYDAMSGDIFTPQYSVEAGYTQLPVDLFDHDSLLLRLTPASDAVSLQAEKGCAEPAAEETIRLTGPAPFALEEENVFMLDQAEYSLDHGPWREKEEILRIDNWAREQFGYRKRTDSFPQPWLTPKASKKEHTVDLRFVIRSKIDCRHVCLAFEGDESVSLIWNGQKITPEDDGYYVDPAIRRVRLGALTRGDNILEMHIPFGEDTVLEWSYLLGAFGVSVRGGTAEIDELPDKIGFGDYAVQGMPFYGGNLSYELCVKVPACHAVLEVPEYVSPLLGVEVDGGEEKTFFAAPYRVSLGTLSAGEHKILLRSYGSRINTFGQVHNCNRNERYFGPLTWRTDGLRWSYEYQLHPCGVMIAPILRIRKIENV